MIYLFILIIAVTLLFYLIKKIETGTLDTKMYKLGTGEEGGDFDIAGKFIEDNSLISPTILQYELSL